MTKLGLQNEKKKEHSKILEYLEHQKELCRENPKRKSCSKTKVSFKKFEYSNDAIVGKYYILAKIFFPSFIYNIFPIYCVILDTEKGDSDETEKTYGTKIGRK